MNVCRIEDRTDHLGNVFKSVEEMSRYYKIPSSTYKGRMRKGWSKEKALTSPHTKNNNIEDRTDHLGNVFKSVEEMCRYYKIPSSTYKGRINKGWSKEKALTAPNTRNNNIEDRTDHLGNVFKSEKEMCRYYKILSGTYKHRINKGWSKEKALTAPNTNAVKIEDHLGNVFKSVEEMCMYYKIPYATYVRRITKGWSKEKALTTKYNINNNITENDRTDHLGNVFKSEKEMCRYYKISYSSYRGRINKGWSKEKALITPVVTNKKYKDPIYGNYLTLSELSKIYKIDKRHLYHKIINFNLLRSLDISITIPRRMININKKKYNLLISKRIKKGKDVFECYIDNGDGTSTFKIMSYDMIDQYCLEQYKIYNNVI